MNLNSEDWKELRFGNLIQKPYKSKAFDRDDLEETDDLKRGIHYITRSGENNGCELIVSKENIPIHAIEKGNAISIGDTTATCFYQAEEFITGDHMVVVRAEWLTEMRAAFILGLLKNEQYKYSYGRAFLMDRIADTILKLPIQYHDHGRPLIDTSRKYSEEGYVPDWLFMENYIKSLHHKTLTTKNVSKNIPRLNVKAWKYFYLKNICEISMGNKLDWSVMTMDKPEVNFVGRSADDNGVAGKVDLLDSVKPYKAGCVTVALGGSLGSSYLQSEDFYTSQNVSVLEFQNEVSDAAKIFISCLIMNESKYKYFPFGRELNTHIRNDFGFTLPIKYNADGTIFIDEKRKYSKEGYVPDWKFMKEYIESLPYGDRL